MSYAVELVAVSKSFVNSRKKDILAVEHINLRIPTGEFFSLLGPSGCGKTTTLRMIAGFEFPSSGEIYIHGEAMANRPPFHRPVNTVFQNYALFPHMTVAENIAFGLQMDGIPNPEIKSRVAEMIALVKLEELEKRYPHQLSGGQQQRVALARALVKRPQVLLFDEPLGALDLKLRKEMQLELKHMQQQIGITFIYVTHDQEEALTMSDRIAVMNEGRVLQIGTPIEIYEEPQTRFVAEFIGETNLLMGRVVEKQKERAVVLVDNKIPVTVVASEDIHLGERVTILIRPEKATLYPADYQLPSALVGVVEDVVYLGTDTRYIIRISSQSRIVIRKQNLDRAHVQQYTCGENVKVSVSLKSIRVLKEG